MYKDLKLDFSVGSIHEGLIFLEGQDEATSHVDEEQQVTEAAASCDED